MPISNNGGTVTYTEGRNMDRAQKTDVHDSASFSVCDATNPLKQIQFDASALSAGSPTIITALPNGVLDNDIAYDPATAGDWSPAPTTLWDAIDQLAARVKALEP
jgi:hypothetical protein